MDAPLPPLNRRVRRAPVRNPNPSVSFVDLTIRPDTPDPRPKRPRPSPPTPPPPSPVGDMWRYNTLGQLEPLTIAAFYTERTGPRRCLPGVYRAVCNLERRMADLNAFDNL